MRLIDPPAAETQIGLLLKIWRLPVELQSVEGEPEILLSCLCIQRLHGVWREPAGGAVRPSLSRSLLASEPTRERVQTQSPVLLRGIVGVYLLSKTCTTCHPFLSRFFPQLDILCNEEILGKDHTLKFVVVTRWRFKVKADAICGMETEEKAALSASEWMENRSRIPWNLFTNV